jgi:hypothetical protein
MVRAAVPSNATACRAGRERTATNPSAYRAAIQKMDAAGTIYS